MNPPRYETARARNDPSSSPERTLVIILAVAGLLIAIYLAAYQLHLFGKVWDPFFGDGSKRVLHSFLSRLLPVPDAVIGVVGYAAELITAAIGGGERWRRIPRLVLIYGAVVAALALAAVLLTAAQIFLIRSFCTLCLGSATLSLFITWLARKEVRASLGIVRKVHHEKHKK